MIGFVEGKRYPCGVIGKALINEDSVTPGVVLDTIISAVVSGNPCK
jgi:hypothetical protein